MTDYVKSTDFAAKDALPTGTPSKIASGTQVDTEFNNIALAIASKANITDISNMLTTSSIASDTEAAALTDNTKVITPNKLYVAVRDAVGDNSQQPGWRGVPARDPGLGNYTCVMGDNGRMIIHASTAGAGDTYTIPANSSVAFPVGATLTFVNLDATNSVSIAITTDTLIMAGTTFTGTRTLAARSYAVALKVTTTQWMISGPGLS